MAFSCFALQVPDVRVATRVPGSMLERDSAQSAETFFRLHFLVVRMGSRGTFVLCTASSRCTSSNTSFPGSMVERDSAQSAENFFHRHFSAI